MPLVVAAKKDPIASTPTSGPFITEVSSTGLGAKATANSAVPFFLRKALQPSPGLRGEFSVGMAVPGISKGATNSAFETVRRALYTRKSSTHFILRRRHLTPRSSRGKAVAKHWQAAARRRACGLILDDIPVLRESAVLETDDIDNDPGCWLAHVSETPVQHQQVALGHDQTVLVSHLSWGALDQIEEAVASGCDMRAVLNVVGRPELAGGDVDIVRLENGRLAEH